MNLPRSLPNQLTILRVILAVVVFVILHVVGWGQGHPQDELGKAVLDRESLLLNLAAVIFALAGITDIADGQIARRWNLTTDFGRIADPFADKVIISGTFTFLISIAGSGVSPWMVVVIVARESLVDGLRGFAESRGIAFPSSWWGKLKMASQSVALTLMLVLLANWHPQDAQVRTYVMNACMAWVIFVTLYSGLLYLLKARTILRQGAQNEAVTPTAQATR